MEHTCKTCYYFRRGPKYQDGSENPSGQCYLNPPTVLRVDVIVINPPSVSARPSVEETDYCSGQINTDMMPYTWRD